MRRGSRWSGGAWSQLPAVESVDRRWNTEYSRMRLTGIRCGFRSLRDGGTAGGCDGTQTGTAPPNRRGRRPGSRFWAKMDIKEAPAATGPELAKPATPQSPRLRF